MNAACNELAGETTTAALDGSEAPDGPVLGMSYEGSRVVLKIGETWVTLRHHQVLYNARSTGPIRTYMMEKYGWNRRCMSWYIGGQ